MSNALRLAVCLAFLLALLGCQRESAAPRAIAPSANRLGVHLLLDDGRNQWPEAEWPAHMAQARALVGRGGYVVQLVRLDDLDVTRWQLFLDLCETYELRPIVRLATTFDQERGWWTAPPPDGNGGYGGVGQLYADFLAALRWPTEERLVVVGNEPNRGGEWGGVPDPAGYANFLIDTATALHEADPAFRVLNAGFDLYAPHTNGEPFVDGLVYMDAESFMDGMVVSRPGVFGYLDGWASHPYPLGPFVQPPGAQTFQFDYLNGATNLNHGVVPAGITNRGINGYEWELAKLSTYGVDDLPVFITETGWRHSETVDSDALDNHPAGLPTAAEVTGYLDLALYGNGQNEPTMGWTPWLADERVYGVAYFALAGLPAEWGHTNLLELDPAGNILAPYVLFPNPP